MRLLVAEADRFDPEALAALRRSFEIEISDCDRATLLRSVAGADVLWTRLRHRVDAEVLAAAPRLCAIVTATTGLNHIDLDEASRRGVQVLSLKGEVEFLKEIRATAEHTVALMLALLRQIPAAVMHVHDGRWDRDRFRGAELFRKTVGVVGYGRLGRIVARLLGAFEADVLVSDPYKRPEQVDEGARLVDLDRLLAQSDIVTLHASLDATTRGLIGSAQIERMKPGAWLINTARGELVDEGALLGALRTGRLAGAAVDVLAGEHDLPPAASPLVAYAREHGNLIVTPHIGGCTGESMARTERFMARKLLDWIEGRGP